MAMGSFHRSHSLRRQRLSALDAEVAETISIPIQTAQTGQNSILY